VYKPRFVSLVSHLSAKNLVGPPLRIANATSV